MAGQDYRDLNAWPRAMDLVAAIYAATEAFPGREKFGLTQQLRRAAVSIPSNIAEGQGRRTPRKFVAFLSIAHGSIREVETQVFIADRLGYLDADSVKRLIDACGAVGRLVDGLRSAIENRSSRPTR